MLCNELKQPALYLKKNEGEINNMFEFLTKESRENLEKIMKKEKEEGKKEGLFETAKKMLLEWMFLSYFSLLTKSYVKPTS